MSQTQRFCGFCACFQGLEATGDIEPKDVEMMKAHLRIHHGMRSPKEEELV